MRAFLTLSLWLVLAFPAAAQNYKVSDLSVGNWSGGAYHNRKTNEFAYCGMFASYKSGIGVHFAIDNEQEWRIGFSSQRFQFRPGNSYSIAYTIDGSPTSVLSGTAKDTTFIIVELPSKSSLFDQFRGGTMLTVSVGGNVHQFRLDGTSRALSVLLDCARENTTGRRDVARETPRPALPPANPAPKPNQSFGGITANDRLDATRFVANLFSRTDFRDYRFMTSDELSDKTLPDVVRSADVAWIAPGAVGLLHIFSTQETSIDDQLSSALASDAKSCKGRFASGKVSDDENSNFKRLYTICDDKDKSFNIEYLFLPRKNGLAYRFGTMIFGRADQAPDSKELREALKKAAFSTSQ
jgi:hypothetical protein